MRNIPLVTHLQISDALQEFLCLPDQIKLIDYDNKKLMQMQSSLLLEQKKASKIKDIVDANIFFSQRLESMMGLMLK